MPGNHIVSVFTKIIEVDQVASITIVGRRDKPNGSSGMETLELELAPVEESQS